MKKRLIFVTNVIIRWVINPLYAILNEEREELLSPLDGDVGLRRLCIDFTLLLLLVIFYPIMIVLYGISKITNNIQGRRQRKVEEKPREKDALYFAYNIGGAGRIFCLDCNYQKDIIGFTHGMYNCDIGRQCQSCGAFFSEYNVSEEYHKISPRTEPLLCPECGVVCDPKETRDEALFCPQCKSKHMKYCMEYIT